MLLQIIICKCHEKCNCEHLSGGTESTAAAASAGVEEEYEQVDRSESNMAVSDHLYMEIETEETTLELRKNKAYNDIFSVTHL